MMIVAILGAMSVGDPAAAQPAAAQRQPAERRPPPAPRGLDETPPDDAAPEDAQRDPLGGPPRRRAPLWTDLPEPERREIERFIEENFPRMAVELDRLKKQNERRFVFRMSRVAPMMRRIIETMKVDPSRAAMMIRERQVELEIFQTTTRFRQSNDESEKRRLRARIEELAGQIFDIRHQRRAGEVRELETRLDLLKSRLNESLSLRAELIQRHVEQMLTRPPPPFADEGDADGPTPDSPGQAPPERP